MVSSRLNKDGGNSADYFFKNILFNMLKPEQNGWLFVYNIFKYNFYIANCIWIHFFIEFWCKDAVLTVLEILLWRSDQVYSYDCLNSRMEFSMLVRQYLYNETSPTAYQSFDLISDFEPPFID